MLIYDRAGKLVACTKDDVLKPLGYESVKKFFSLHNDLSEIFIQRAGYIATYDNLSWVSFLFNEIFPQNKILVQCGSNECEFFVKTTQLFSQDMNTIGVNFEEVAKSDENATIAVIQEKTQDQPAETKPVPISKDKELMQLLDTTFKEARDETDVEKEKPTTSFDDDLEQFDLDFKEEKEPEPQKKPKEEEPSKQDDDLYDLGLDFSKDEEEKKRYIAQEEKIENIDFSEELEEFKLDLKDEDEIQEPSSSERIKDIPTEKESEFEQYIDSKEYESAKEVDLENLSNELGLEYEESANFIYDFTTMIKAKEELLTGDNAAIEAASLKNIAENFRLFNIVKTLETIENGEPNAPLLFSQIEKLQKELVPYVKQPQSQQNSSIAWDDAVKQQVEFDPNVAAESLGLPIELINEFVNDFIEQAKESKDLFNDAFTQNDIKTIKETAHKLKGAAANLRIEPIATKLEELQHNNDLDAVPNILIEFWGMYQGLSEAVQ